MKGAKLDKEFWDEVEKQKRIILRELILRKKQKKGITNVELAQMGILRYGARIRDLREEGHIIRCQKLKGNVYEYFYEGWQKPRKEEKRYVFITFRENMAKADKRESDKNYDALLDKLLRRGYNTWDVVFIKTPAEYYPGPKRKWKSIILAVAIGQGDLEVKTFPDNEEGFARFIRWSRERRGSVIIARKVPMFLDNEIDLDERKVWWDIKDGRRIEELRDMIPEKRRDYYMLKLAGVV